MDFKKTESNFRVIDTFQENTCVDFERNGYNYRLELSYKEDPENILYVGEFTEDDIDNSADYFENNKEFGFKHIVISIINKYNEILDKKTDGDFFLLNDECFNEKADLCQFITSIYKYPGFKNSMKTIKVDFDLCFDDVNIYYPDGELILTSNQVLPIDDVRRQIYEKKIPGCYATSPQHPGITYYFDERGNWPFQHQHTEILSKLIKPKDKER